MALNVNFLDMVASTSLGFVSALGVEWLVDWLRVRGERAALIQDVVEELRSNREEIGRLRSDQLYDRPYNTSRWDGAVVSGSAASLRGHRSAGSIAKVYGTLASANYWQRLFAETYLRDGADAKSTKTLAAALADQRKNIVSEIDSVVSLLER